MAHAPLLRTNTAPVFRNPTDGLARLQNTMSMSGAPRASQLSGSTFYTSTTSPEFARDHLHGHIPPN